MLDINLEDAIHDIEGCATLLCGMAGYFRECEPSESDLRGLVVVSKTIANSIEVIKNELNAKNISVA